MLSYRTFNISPLPKELLDFVQIIYFSKTFVSSKKQPMKREGRTLINASREANSDMYGYTYCILLRIGKMAIFSTEDLDATPNLC